MPSESHHAEPQDDLPHGSLAHALLLVRPVFDAEFYREQYRDVHGDAEALLLHFCERGWREGRNPNPEFDTVAYLATHPDVTQVGWNPAYHYELAGRRENRAVEPASRSRTAAAAMFGVDPGDWVALLRPEVDKAFYAAQAGVAPVEQPQADWFDLVAHFAYRGWKTGLDPNPGFNVEEALAARPELRERGVNPLVAAIVERKRAEPAHQADPAAVDKDDPAIVTTRFHRHQLFGIADRLQALQDVITGRRENQSVRYTDPVERLVADQLDANYYNATYRDVGEHQTDPVEHFCQQGWMERRNPCIWFDTAYYLTANPDVAASNVNPFWHYLAQGHSEGRRPHRPGGYRREVIERAIDPEGGTRHWSRPDATALLTRSRVDRILGSAMRSASGLVISLSHDCYTRVTGGIQLFIADEQARYARQGMVYLHLSPYVPLLRLVDPAETGCLVNMVLDGRYVGVTSYADITATLGRIAKRPDERRLFLVHCLLGHHLPDIIRLQDASASTTNVFWVHDYSSICLGYTLLRNDVAYCHAPPPESMSCRVCVYGDTRVRHLQQVHSLFQTLPFHVVAPSPAALDIWLEHAKLPHVSAVAHEHCNLVPADEAVPERKPNAPVRVAFIGYARAHKGWPIWMEVVSRTRSLGAYEFIHLGSHETVDASLGLRHYDVQTSAGHPDAMVDAVRDLEIDLVLVLSTWPETFSYVTFEALAGGADVVCLADSGNVADTVLRRGRGVVVANEKSLSDFFTSLRAVEYVRLCREQGSTAGQLVREGTTATLTFADA